MLLTTHARHDVSRPPTQQTREERATQAVLAEGRNFERGGFPHARIGTLPFRDDADGLSAVHFQPRPWNSDFDCGLHVGRTFDISRLA